MGNTRICEIPRVYVRVFQRISG
eukprot:COSAG02_NODE_16060_length_1117_cov_0.761297_1_plen_22_part_10